MSYRVFDGARIVGDVRIGEGSSVWYNAVLRGDIEPITVGKCSNIQDNCVVHSTRGFPVEIGDLVSVGHAAVLHGCRVMDNVLIGMNSTVLNGAVIGENSIVGAGAVVTEGKEFPGGSLILGVPARTVRTLDEDEIGSIRENAIRYSRLARI
ncbi:gamma carbonic anhydrase family protein [Methanothermobacter wolfeii]|uniref:gamma carbonic anhydrase family protein n=1 Tax=Methanothermobacter wolfeii TaxID=145261 RepID=UPI0024B377B0|nr:gamma carbonic anhydrase family protein [Methanothermobacter wolfeii]MDI6701887.1 gamma carbonic anhydrase family protein [Methanothermobacter wolfeii]MDI6841332.1 gamma carbonic anhydrase family protein [Methanothermobacter wolfeii]